MAVLDTILIKEIVNTSTTVNADYVSDSIDISFREAEFSIQLDYDNGVNVNMEIAIEVSNDNVSFVPIGDSVHVITDPDGTSLFDIGGTGTNYLRVAVTVTTGSVDIQQITYKAKRRH